MNSEVCQVYKIRVSVQIKLVATKFILHLCKKKFGIETGMLRKWSKETIQSSHKLMIENGFLYLFQTK